jgi:hypothetical protein
MSRTQERVTAIVQPILFAWSAVFAMAAEVVTPPEALLRPLVVSAVFALAVLGVSLIATRNWPLASVLASGLVLFSVRNVLFGLALIGVVVWWYLIVLVRRLQDRKPPAPSVPRAASRASGILSLVLAGVTGWTLISAYANGDPNVSFAGLTARGTGGPSVYLLLLDGYPSEETLSADFQIDNSTFLNQLGERGFDVLEHAPTNYNKTWLTLASMFSGEYVDRLLAGYEIPGTGEMQIRWLSSMIQHAPLLDTFRQRGYVIKAVPSPFASTALRTADEYVDPGGLTELEVRLMSASPLSLLLRDPLLGFLLAGQERHVRDSIELTAQLAERAPETPQLVFSHIHSPHTPFVLHPEGTEPAYQPDCLPTFCPLWNSTAEELEFDPDDYRYGLETQLAELNRLLAQTVDRIIAADPSAIVVLMSDHGIRYSLEDLDEHYRAFLAVRAPGRDDLFPDGTSPVNILRLILRSLGEDIEPVEYERWNVEWTRYLDMQKAEVAR